jgi:AbrB family looped-hinge helix DNA binding protein
MNAPKGKYAWTVKVGEKGQFVIPKQAREVFHIKPGDTLILLADEKQGIAIPPKEISPTWPRPSSAVPCRRRMTNERDYHDQPHQTVRRSDRG